MGGEGVVGVFEPHCLTLKGILDPDGPLYLLNNVERSKELFPKATEGKQVIVNRLAECLRAMSGAACKHLVFPEPIGVAVFPTEDP